MKRIYVKGTPLFFLARSKESVFFQLLDGMMDDIRADYRKRGEGDENAWCLRELIRARRTLMESLEDRDSNLEANQ